MSIDLKDFDYGRFEATLKAAPPSLAKDFFNRIIKKASKQKIEPAKVVHSFLVRLIDAATKVEERVEFEKAKFREKHPEPDEYDLKWLEERTSGFYIHLNGWELRELSEAYKADTGRIEGKPVDLHKMRRREALKTMVAFGAGPAIYTGVGARVGYKGYKAKEDLVEKYKAGRADEEDIQRLKSHQLIDDKGEVQMPSITGAAIDGALVSAGLLLYDYVPSTMLLGLPLTPMLIRYYMMSDKFGQISHGYSDASKLMFDGISSILVNSMENNKDKGR